MTTERNMENHVVIPVADESAVPQHKPGQIVCDAGHVVGWDSCEVCGATMDEPCRLFWRTANEERTND